LVQLLFTGLICELDVGTQPAEAWFRLLVR